MFEKRDPEYRSSLRESQRFVSKVDASSVSAGIFSEVYGLLQGKIIDNRAFLREFHAEENAARTGREDGRDEDESLARKYENTQSHRQRDYCFSRPCSRGTATLSRYAWNGSPTRSSEVKRKPRGENRAIYLRDPAARAAMPPRLGSRTAPPRISLSRACRTKAAL